MRKTSSSIMSLVFFLFYSFFDGLQPESLCTSSVADDLDCLAALNDCRPSKASLALRARAFALGQMVGVFARGKDASRVSAYPFDEYLDQIAFRAVSLMIPK